LGDHNLIIQTKYSRVLLVSQAKFPPADDLGGGAESKWPGWAAAVAADQYSVSQVFQTLQEAADNSRGGDLIAVMPGHYAGFIVSGEKPEAGDGKYIHFKAMGNPGDVIINQPPPGERKAWWILLTATNHIIIEGFNLDGSDYAQYVHLRSATEPGASLQRPPTTQPRLDWTKPPQLRQFQAGQL